MSERSDTATTTVTPRQHSTRSALGKNGVRNTHSLQKQRQGSPMPGNVSGLTARGVSPKRQVSSTCHVSKQEHFSSQLQDSTGTVLYLKCVPDGKALDLV